MTNSNCHTRRSFGHKLRCASFAPHSFNVRTTKKNLNMIKANIGIDLGGTKLLIICGNERCHFETGPAFSPTLMETIVRNFLKERNISPLGIGFAIPGFVDRSGNIGSCDVLPKMTGWIPADTFADYNCKIITINDVNAALNEEMHDEKNGITGGVIMVGTAVGAAFITEGVHLLGTSGLAGELGYMPMGVNGEVKRLDELAGGAFLASKLNINGKRLAELAHSGDKKAMAIIRAGGNFLGIALSTVINLLNPSKLALGGGTITLPGYFDAVNEAVNKYSIPELRNACSIYKVRSGESVAALGALRCLQG
jgi:predicted NBD/HSP70 family sugar kinase